MSSEWRRACPGPRSRDSAPDGSYEGNFTVKLGPTTASYRGSLKMDSLDEASRTATMHANGTDKRGQGGAGAPVIVSTLREEGEETVVDVATDFNITGRLARFGRGGMIEDISKRMMRDFSQCLQGDGWAAEQAAPARRGARDARRGGADAAGGVRGGRRGGRRGIGGRDRSRARGGRRGRPGAAGAGQAREGHLALLLGPVGAHQAACSAAAARLSHRQRPRRWSRA